MGIQHRCGEYSVSFNDALRSGFYILNKKNYQIRTKLIFIINYLFLNESAFFLAYLV